MLDNPALKTPVKVALTAESEVFSFESPAFTTTPPETVNTGLLSPRLNEIYRQLWNQNSPAKRLTCHLVKEAIVDGPGLVFDAECRLVGDSVHQTTPGEIDSCWEELERSVATGTVPRVPGVTLLCEKSGIGNYGHWLVEMLPVVYLNRQWLKPLGWRVRLPKTSEAMNLVVQDSIDLLGIPRSQQLWREPGPQRYEQLVMMKGLSHHGITYSPRIVECLEALGEAVVATAPRKIWVSRAGAARSFANEGEICERLAELGWSIVQPGSLTLKEQIALFKGADEIAGVAGAGMTNLVFAPRGIRVTVFMPARMPDVFFYMMAGFKQQHYREVRCPQNEDPSGNDGWETTMHLSTHEVVTALMA